MQSKERTIEQSERGLWFVMVSDGGSKKIEQVCGSESQAQEWKRWKESL